MSGEHWLFIPGTLCDARVFGPLLDQLEGTLSGTVRVADGLDDDDLPALARRLTEGLGPRLRIVGFSLGCQVAFEIMRRVPARCSSVVLISTNARADLPALASDRRAMVERFERDGAAGLIDGDLWSRYVAEPDRPDHPARDPVHAMARDTPVEHFRAQTELAIHRPDSRASLAQFDGPILVINGADDRLTPVEMGAEIVAAARQGSQTIIARAGHFVLMEKPEAVGTSILDWMGRLPRE